VSSEDEYQSLTIPSFPKHLPNSPRANVDVRNAFSTIPFDALETAKKLSIKFTSASEPHHWIFRTS